MNRSLLFILLLVYTALSAQEDPCADSRCNLAEAEMKAHLPFFRNQAGIVANDYNQIYQRCEWRIDPAVYFISGKITTYFKPTISGFQQLTFDLSDSLLTDSIYYHGSHLTSAMHGGNRLLIPLPAAIPQGQVDSISVAYHGKPISSGFGSFYQGAHHGAPVVWTLSEPYGARDWWPCKQNLIDKIDSLDILVTVPNGNLVGSNGVIVSETMNGNLKTVHWKTRYPTAAYLVAIAVTNYTAYSHYFHFTGTTDSMEVMNYVYPEDLTWARTVTPGIVQTMMLYDSLTIPYPFRKEKYGHAEFGWGGGMEHQTMSFIGGFSNVLLAHECAHQWFGDDVTLGSWTDIWLNEGFATYFEGLTEQRYFPQNWLDWKKSTINSAVTEPHGSVRVDDTTSVARVFSAALSYSKGSYLLHMLRCKLGDSVFFRGLREYLSDPALSYQYAHTPDLIHHLESASGLSLQSFFKEWYEGRGYPSYQTEWSQDGQMLTLTINQTQSDASVAFYEMPVPIEFMGEGHDTILVFNHLYSGQTFTARLNFTAEYAYFDPALTILSAHNLITQTLPPSSLLSPLVIFPNPSFTSRVKVRNNNPSNAMLELTLYDLPGNIIRHMTISGNENLQELDISGVAAGVYELKIRTNQGIAVKKLEIK